MVWLAILYFWRKKRPLKIKMHGGMSRGFSHSSTKNLHVTIDHKDEDAQQTRVLNVVAGVCTSPSSSSSSSSSSSRICSSSYSRASSSSLKEEQEKKRRLEKDETKSLFAASLTNRSRIRRRQRRQREREEGEGGLREKNNSARSTSRRNL